MTPEDEEKAMKDYFEYEGRQNCCQKILVITLHRLQLFYRSGVQWIAILIPLAFVAWMCFVFYTIVRSVVKDPEEVDEVVPIMIKVIFGIFLIYDTQLILGEGRHKLQIDDYILGALILYTDIIMIFYYLLMLCGGR